MAAICPADNVPSLPALSSVRERKGDFVVCKRAKTWEYLNRRIAVLRAAVGSTSAADEQYPD